MAENQSVIKKGERIIDDAVDLWHRRRFVCIIVLLIVFLPIIVSVIWIPILKSELNDVKSELETVTRERDKYELKLAPFEAVANRVFDEAPKDKRLELLDQKINEMITKIEEGIDVMQQTAKKALTGRTISEDTARQITGLLKAITGYKLNIECTMGDSEAFALAEQIKKIFESAGWNVGSVNQSMYVTPFSGLIVHIKKEPPKALQKPLGLLFNALGYTGTAFLNPKLDIGILKIAVGSK